MAITGNIERPGGMVSWVTPDTGPMENFALEVPAPTEMPLGSDKFRLLTKPPFAICHVETMLEGIRSGKGPIKIMHIQGSNPLLCYANSRAVLEALLKLGFLSVADIYMSPTAEYADVVLPVAHWLETDDIYDMHPRFFISAVQKAVEPQGEAWPDNKIFNELGKRIAPQWWFKNVEEMLNYQLRKARITWEQFKRIGVLAKTGKEQIYYKYKTGYWRKEGGFNTRQAKWSFIQPLWKGWDMTRCHISRNPMKAHTVRQNFIKNIHWSCQLEADHHTISTHNTVKILG